MTKQEKQPQAQPQQYRVNVRLSDGGTGAHDVGTILEHEALAKYVSAENIAALVAANFLEEVKNG